MSSAASPLMVRGPDGRLLATNLAWDAAPADGGPRAGRGGVRARCPDHDHMVTAGELLGSIRLGPGAPACFSLARLLLERRESGVQVWTLRPAAGAADPVTSVEGPDDSEDADSPDSPHGGDGLEGAASPAGLGAAEASVGPDAGRYWVWAARDGRLSARTDRCFATLDTALALAEAVADSLGCPAPEVLDQARTRSALAALADLAPSAWKAARLQPLTLVTPARMAAAACAILVVMGLAVSGHGLWRAHQLAQSHAAREARADSHKARVQAVLDHPERRFAADFLTAPRPAALIAARAPVLLNHPLAANGWALERLEADGAGLDATWKLTPQASLLLPPGGAVLNEKDLARALARTALEPLAKAEARDWRRLPSRPELSAWVTEFTRRCGLKQQLSWKPPARAQVDREAVLCPWVTGTVTWSRVPGYLVTDWPSLAALFDRPIPAMGLVLTSLAWTGDAWSITGNVYAKR